MKGLSLSPKLCCHPCAPSSECMLLQEYSPAAEVLIQQAKAPGPDGGSYINAAKHVAPAPQVNLSSIACMGTISTHVQKGRSFCLSCLHLRRAQ